MPCTEIKQNYADTPRFKVLNVLSLKLQSSGMLCSVGEKTVTDILKEYIEYLQL